MNSRPKRWLVYQAWLQFRHLNANTSALATSCKDYTIPIYITLSNGDKIIEKRQLMPYLNKLNLAKFLVLDCSHNQLIERSKVLF
jgi:hypothetical protein